MENKTKILAFAAVALMFAVCFIGFVAINDGEVDATDSKSITTADDLIKAGKDGGEYKLDANITLTSSLVIESGKTVSIDLNKKTITGNITATTGDLIDNTNAGSGHVIVNYGTLTIKGDGVVQTSNKEQSTILNMVGGVVKLTGGTYKIIENEKGYYVLKNLGEMYIYQGATVGGDAVKLSSLVANGWYDGSKNSSKTNSKMTIYGGTFTGGLNTIKNDDWGVLTIYDGIFNNNTQCSVMNWNVATIYGGIFKQNEVAERPVLTTGHINDESDQGMTTIYGGSFYAGSENTCIALNTSQGDVEQVKYNIYGGSYSTDPRSFVDTGVDTIVNSDGSYNKYVVNPSASITSSSQTVYYDSIASAVNNAGVNETVKVLRDVDLHYSSVVVKKSVTINLNGKTIESSALVFDIMSKDVTFTIDANGGSILTKGTVVWTNTDKEGYAHANPNVNVNGGIYSGNYVFINYAENGSFSIDKAVVNGKGAGIWFGNGPASNVSITDSTIVATDGIGIYLGTVKEATLTDVNVTGKTGIEIKSGTVTIDGNSTVIGTAKYVAKEDMNNNGSGGSVAAICINNAYVDVFVKEMVERTDYVSVTIGDSVTIISKNGDLEKICITSGHKHDKTESVDNAPIFVESKLSDKEVGTVFMSDCKSPIIYNGVARVINDYMYDMIKDDSRVDSYLIESEDGDISLKDLKGNIILNTDKNVTLSKLTNDITVKGKVGALTITGSGNESVSVELDSAKTLCISNVKNVKVDGCTFTTDSYVKVNGGESVVNISNVKETVSVKNVTINAKGDVKGQGISIMNCGEVKQIVVSDNKIYNAGHHSIMIGSVFAELKTLDITNNTFSEWGCKIEYSSAIHMFGKGGSSVVATISNNTFGCVMKDSSRLGKIISIGYQNGNNSVDDGKYIGNFENPVLFTKNVVNGKATDDFELVVEEKATTYLDFGTKYAGKAISSVRQDGINHKAISYGDFTIVSTTGKMMDIGNNGSIVINGTVTCEGIIKNAGNVSVYGTLELTTGAKLAMSKDSIFTGVILGPDGNKLVANGMKAGEGGIAITGGSLIINGDIISESGSVAGATVTVTGDGIKISGSLGANVTMVIEKDTIVTVKSGDEFSFNGTITNNGTLRIEDSTTITTVETSKVVNNGVVVDERAKEADAVPVTNDGTVVAKNNADMYKGEGVDVVEQDPDKPVATEGKIEVNTNKYAFITPITTTGKLNIVMNDGYKQYTVTIPEGTAIAAGTVISVSFIEYQSDSVTRYQINTPGIENFSMKLPCQIGFKKAKVYCDDSELGVSKVRYDAGTGYVTFDASHNSVFTIVLSNASPAGTTTVSGGDVTNDYSLVIAFVVLVASLGFLAYVIKRR